jgi:diphthamide biosynthesis protein 7
MSRALTNRRLISSAVTENSSVLDVKQLPANPDVILSAQSTGTVIVWHYSSEAKKLELVHETESLGEPDSALVTALAVSNADPDIISVTLTSGEVLVAKASESRIEVQQRYQSHMDSAWISAFGTGSFEKVLFSGGDDCVISAFDIRQDTPSWKKTFHSAGVTSILPSGTHGWNTNADPYEVWTGGYDDCLRSWDLRMPEFPTYGKALNLGGGVWRLLPRPNDCSNRVLACCMYGGARILHPNSSTLATVTETVTEGHASIVYGGAWTSSSEFFTCSFYDKQLRKWNLG